MKKNTKKNYESPKIEIIRINMDDIIITSGGGSIETPISPAKQ